MARSRDIFSFRRNFLLLLLSVVLPSAALSGFGVLAIKNERAAVEKNLEAAYGTQLSRREEAVARHIDQPLAQVAVAFEGKSPEKAAEVLHAMDPLIGPIALYADDGMPRFAEHGA